MQITSKLAKTMSTKCILTNLATKNEHILRNKEVLVLGRNRETMIEDLHVSKQQLACIADLKSYKIKIKSIGKAVSGVNGYALSRGIVYSVGHGDIIELILGKHKYEIQFDPSPVKEDIEEPKPKKIKLDSSKTETASMSVGYWENIKSELLIYTPSGCKASNKIAGFDIDGTITKTKSGARFPKNVDDWTFCINENQLKSKLKDLQDTGFKIVFFTNQSGVGKDASKISEFKTKIENVVKALKIPIQVFIATAHTIHRKPRPGMWNVLNEHKNDNLVCDMGSSFYVGDAAGREKNWAPKRNKDHSCCDRLFALNIGLKFYTPEEYFLKASRASYKMPEFNPMKLSNQPYPNIDFHDLNVILMVGGPGSGKSHFCRQMLIPNGYAYVNRDQLGSWQKCVKVMEEKLQNKINVVIDNTNGDKEARKKFIEAAQKNRVDVRCCVMDTSLAHMRHNNIFRQMTDDSHAHITDIIIYSYNKNFQPPEKSEGFKDIIKIPFVAQFSNSEHEKLYKMFLLEK